MSTAKNAANIKDQARHLVLVDACYKAFTEEVKKQAEQRINSRFIMCIVGIHE